MCASVHVCVCVRVCVCLRGIRLRAALCCTLALMGIKTVDFLHQYSAGVVGSWKCETSF